MLTHGSEQRKNMLVSWREGTQPQSKSHASEARWISTVRLAKIKNALWSKVITFQSLHSFSLKISSMKLKLTGHKNKTWQKRGKNPR